MAYIVAVQQVVLAELSTVLQFGTGKHRTVKISTPTYSTRTVRMATKAIFLFATQIIAPITTIPTIFLSVLTIILLPMAILHILA